MADAGGKLGKTVSDKLTSRPENNPDRIRYYGDLISALDFNAKTVMPSEEFKQKYSPHSYRGLSIQDKVPEHDIEITPLTSQPVDVKSQQLTKYKTMLLEGIWSTSQEISSLRTGGLCI